MTAVPFLIAALLALPAAAPARGVVERTVADQVERSQPQPLNIPNAGRFQDWDRNNDGVITRMEWRGTAQQFRDLDWNHDGMLSGDEVREVDGSVTPNADDWTDEAFVALDRNHDQRISRAEWRYEADLFRPIDRNGDNVVSRAEFLGNDVARTSYDPEANDHFDELDFDNSGSVERDEWDGDYAEFRRLDRNRNGVLSRRELNAAGDIARTSADEFWALDRNGNGVLSRNEWRGSQSAFRQHDLNRDGVITRNEYNRVEGSIDDTNDIVNARAIRVDSRQPWTDTGIYVRAGDVVTYQAEGTIQMRTDPRDLASPAGSATGRNAKGSPRPDRSAGGLVARIGDAPAEFLGASGTFTAQTSGQLYLGVNDDYLEDNTGDYRVTLRVQPR